MVHLNQIHFALRHLECYFVDYYLQNLVNYLLMKLYFVDSFDQLAVESLYCLIDLLYYFDGFLEYLFYCLNWQMLSLFFLHIEICTQNLLRSKMKCKTCKPKKDVVTYVGFDRNILNMKIQADTQKDTKSSNVRSRP